MLQNPNDFCEIFNARGEISLKTHAAITEGGFTECDRLSPTAIRFDLLSLSLCSAFNMQIGLSHERPNICNKTRSWPNAINMLMWSCFFHYRTPRHWRFSAFFHARSSLKIMKIEFNSLVGPNYNYVNGACFSTKFTQCLSKSSTDFPVAPKWDCRQIVSAQSCRIPLHIVTGTLGWFSWPVLIGSALN